MTIVLGAGEALRVWGGAWLGGKDGESIWLDLEEAEYTPRTQPPPRASISVSVKWASKSSTRR